MSYMDRTFCPPELADKPDCAECWRKFDEYKYRMHCARTGVDDEDVSFSVGRLCELSTSQKPVSTKLVLGTEHADNNTNAKNGGAR